jgi:hypothetical protein
VTGDAEFFTVLVVNLKLGFDQPETIFSKLKEVFVKNRPDSKNLSLFLHMCYGLGDPNGSLQPYFSIFQYLRISCFSHHLWAHITRI